MEPKEAIERVVIASALLATSFIPKNSEVKASYYNENIPSYSNPLPQKEFATEQELSPEPNYCEIPRQGNDSLISDFVDWDPFFPNSIIGPQKFSEKIVENEKSGLHFKAGDIDDLIEKIRILSQNNSEITRMGEFARKKIETYYTPEINYKILKSIFQKVAH